MFSVVIPLFNKSAYIEKCLNSVLTQTYKKFELIVINDGSTDDGLAKVNNYIYSDRETKSENRIPNSEIKLINQTNCGVSTARNNGVKNAKYDYIAFLDADDWWEPTYLEEMKSLIELFPEAGIYGSGYYIVKNGHSRIATVGLEPSFSKGIINYCKVYIKTFCMPLWTGATIIRKALFEKENGFNPMLKLGEDFDLWIRIVLKYPVALLNKPLAYYSQDVDKLHRAIGKLYDIETNYLWNMNYLSGEEKANKELKKLLDHLRVTSVLNYYLNDYYRREAYIILDKVDWSQQPESVHREYYITPVWWLKFQYLFLRKGLLIKGWLLTIFK